MTAYDDGVAIESAPKAETIEWVDDPYPCWNFQGVYYRTKEVLLEGCRLNVGDVIYRKSDGRRYVVQCIKKDKILFCDSDSTGTPRHLPYARNAFIGENFTRIPPKPKVMKKVERWLNVRHVSNLSLLGHASEGEAQAHATSDAFQIKITAEVEVDA